MFKKLVARFRSKIPNPSVEMIKGDLGNVAVFGGSFEYTGAPYFAAASALQTGADLSYVFCPESAAVPIKCYSPDVIVIPILEKDVASCKRWLKKMNSIIIGPGLGRSPCDENLIEIINEAKLLKIPSVIDADGINFLIRNAGKVELNENFILTPNSAELQRIKKHLNISDEKDVNSTLSLISKHFNFATIIKKDSVDLITNGISEVLSDPELHGSLKRCGGQGDILDGIIAVFVYWAKKQELEEPILTACCAAVFEMRNIAAKAYEKEGRSLTASKILNYIPVNL